MTKVLPTQPQAGALALVTSWRILPLLMLVAALAHFNRISIAVAGSEQIIPHAGVAEARMGLVYSAFLVFYTLFMVPGGWFIDRFGPRAAWLLLGAGSAVFVALTGLVGLVWTGPLGLFAGLLVVRSLLGITNAPLHPTGARLVGNWVPPSGAALANGLITGAACAGMAATYVVFGLLIDWFGWPRAFLVSAAVTLLVTLAWAAAGADHPPGAPAGTRREPGPAAGHRLVRLLGNRSLVCLTLSYGAYGYFQYLFFYWAPYYFNEQLGLGKETSRVYSSLLTLAMGAGMVAGGLLSDRAQTWFGPRRGLALVPGVGLLLSGLFLFLGLVVREPGLILLCFALAMGVSGAMEGPSWMTAVRLGGRWGGTAAGVMNTGGNAGGLLAPALTPLIGDLLGWQAGLAVAGVACLVGSVLWLAIDPAEGLDDLATPAES
jgi:MFS family permease